MDLHIQHIMMQMRVAYSQYNCSETIVVATIWRVVYRTYMFIHGLIIQVSDSTL